MKQSEYISPEFFGLDPEEVEWRECFRNKLDRLMRKNHISNRNLAEVVGLSSYAISSYRTGKSLPNPYTITKIAKALNCTTSALIDF